MNPRTLSSFVIVVVGGLLFGFSIGFIAPLEAFYTRLSNCSATTDKDLCDWISPEGIQGCKWETLHLNVTDPKTNKTTLQTEARCAFASGYGNCSVHNSMDSCKNDPSGACVWDDTGKQCNHMQGWTAIENGVIATMMIIGAFITSLFAGRVVDRLGLKKTLAIASAINIVAGVMQFGAWADPSFGGRLGILLVSRFILGVSVGLSTVVCPMYVGEVSLPELASVISVNFQVFITFGIVVAAGLGYALRPPTEGCTKGDADKFHVLNGFNLFFTVLQGLAAWWVVDPATVRDATQIVATSDSVNNKGANECSDANEGDHLVAVTSPSIKDGSMEADAGLPIFKRPKWLFVAFILGSILQLSGINGVMNFSAKVASDIGMSNPFLANFLVMIVNFVTTILSIFVAKKVHPRTAFYAGGILCGAMCLLTGVPTFPGVVDDADTRNALLATGILLFVALFEILVGPNFYYLAQSSFPADIRSDGCALSLAANFVLNAVVNFAFPPSVQALSGGPSGNQRKGLATVFVIFAALSVLSTAALWLLVGNRHIGVPEEGDTSNNGQQQQQQSKRSSTMSDRPETEPPSGLYGTSSPKL